MDHHLWFHFNMIRLLSLFAFPSRPVCAAVATSVSAIYGTEIFQTGEGRKVHSEIEMASYSLAPSISCERPTFRWLHPPSEGHKETLEERVRDTRPF